MKVKSLHIYPVKSLGGIEVTSSIVTPKGFLYDRNWMLIDEDGKFITQRTFPQMSQIQTSIIDKTLHFKQKSTQASFSLPIQDKYGTSRPAKIWSSDVEVQTISSAIDDYFAECIGVKCHLVFLPKPNVRSKTTAEGKIESVASLADKSPFLITNTASLEELNTRLTKPVAMSRFRANIIYEGQKAWEEDNISDLKINNILFKKVENCGRCSLINTDQETGEVYAEPLKTLKSYRRSPIDRQIKFGARYGVELPVGEPAVIKLGDVFAI